LVIHDPEELDAGNSRPRALDRFVLGSAPGEAQTVAVSKARTFPRFDQQARAFRLGDPPDKQCIGTRRRRRTGIVHRIAADPDARRIDTGGCEVARDRLTDGDEPVDVTPR
jgi:hypothetical protein